MKAQILTPWIGTGSIEDPFRPLLGDVIKCSWTDVTAQPSERLHPDPNLFVVAVNCSADDLAVVESDGRFFVLWSEE